MAWRRRQHGSLTNLKRGKSERETLGEDPFIHFICDPRALIARLQQFRPKDRSYATRRAPRERKFNPLMRCPKCKRHLLRIEVQFQGFVTVLCEHPTEYQVMQPVAFTSHWEEDSSCMCEECDWVGCVREAMGAAEMEADIE
jgi:hypothetical protein